jgi:hypothetical protein
MGASGIAASQQQMIKALWETLGRPVFSIDPFVGTGAGLLDALHDLIPHSDRGNLICPDPCVCYLAQVP